MGYKQKAAQQHIDAANTLSQQVAALKRALSGKGMRAALDQKVANVDLLMRQEDRILRKQYGAQVGALADTSSDNEKAASSQSYAALANRGRERGNAMGEALANGAGESDLLRAQSMALNNWNANQNEINRAFFDTKNSINASLVDLTASTQTARINNASQADADRGQLWNDYYGQRSEALINLGNVQGQMALEYGSAREMKASKKTKRLQKEADEASAKSYMQAARNTGRAYDSPGVSKKLMTWDGVDPFESDAAASASLGATVTTIGKPKPEGASLRSWS